jgi:hypothetical protein
MAKSLKSPHRPDIKFEVLVAEVADIETGDRPPNERLIHLISTELSVNKHWLLSGEGEMFSSVPERKLERMTALFKGLRPEFQDFVLRQIDELLELQKVKGREARARPPRASASTPSRPASSPPK